MLNETFPVIFKHRVIDYVRHIFVSLESMYPERNTHDEIGFATYTLIVPLNKSGNFSSLN